MNLRLGFLLLYSGFIVGCADLQARPEAVTVWKPLGSLQCSGGGTTVDALAHQLRQAGVAVLAVACGHDGRMRPAMCGRPDGRIGIFDIAGADADKAAALGYLPLAQLPDATRQPCP